MKIAFVTELFYPRIAGCERRFFEIGRRLAKRGHEVHVFTLRFDSALLKEEEVDGMLVHRYACSSNYISPTFLRSFAGICKYSFMTFQRLLRQKFDAYYCNEWPMFHSIFMKPVASPVIQEWCEVWADSKKMMILQNMLKLTGNFHVAVSEFTRRRLADLLKIECEKVSVIPNGVDFAKFSENSDRKNWGRIVYVGRLVPHKHVDMLVDAFQAIKQRVPEAELHIVGSGYSLPLIRDRASPLEGCFVHGFLPDHEMLRILKSSQIFVLPSEREGSGISCLEAMAAGLPVITTDYPNNAARELLKDAGAVVVAPTSNAIAEAILNLHANEDLWEELSGKATKYAVQHSWDRATDIMEKELKVWTS